jgi:hypothetical protein
MPKTPHSVTTHPSRKRLWHADPDISDEPLCVATGRAWETWCELIDTWPGRHEGHAAIAAYLSATHAVDPWWAQAITVGYERITGLRLPYQQADGSFTVSKSPTVNVDAAELRERLLSDAGRAELLPGLKTILRSRSSAKVLRLEMDLGIALLTIEPKPGGKTKVTVEHQQLPTPAAVDQWREHWTEWLAALGPHDFGLSR